MDTISLISEVNKDFQRTMNKIIFETFLEEQKGCDFYPTELKLPPKGDKKDIPYFGMIELEKTRGIKEKIILDYRKVQFEEPKDFTDTFKDFCFASLYIKKEVIKAL
jgi:dynein heavy chain